MRNTLLHELFSLGIVAASIFIKNPAHQQHAQTIVDALTPLVGALDTATTAPPAVQAPHV